MPVISDRQIAAAAFAGGFRGSELPIAVAVALAESDGDTSVRNTKNKNGSTDYGLWQINSIHSQILAGGQWDDANSNAKMAFQVYNDAGKKWTPWSAYKNQRYRIYLGRAALATRNTKYAVPPPSTEAPSGGSSGLPDISGIASSIEFMFDPSNWRRVGMFLGGLLLAALGLFGIVKDTSAFQNAKAVGEKALKTAGTVAMAVPK